MILRGSGINYSSTASLKDNLSIFLVKFRQQKRPAYTKTGKKVEVKKPRSKNKAKAGQKISQKRQTEVQVTSGDVSVDHYQYDNTIVDPTGSSSVDRTGASKEITELREMLNEHSAAIAEHR